MTEKKVPKWSKDHARMFGNRTAEWAETYAAWHEFFTEDGATSAQLEAAVIAVAKRSRVPIFAAEHFNAMKEEVRDIRNREYEAAVKAAKARTPCCQTCGFRATITVPSGLSEANIETWIGGSASVVCDRCDMAKIEGHRGMTLSEFEAKNPNWRELYARWNAMRKAQSESTPSTEEARYQAARARLAKHANTTLGIGVNQ